ncbi:MAG TPA: hypothetical protein VHT53_11745 [Candidatus Elarobacter sp.]|jgi:hypothetical protein|nr:hypothetical protein [Candidatus Elarobacter sp.]
MTFARRLVTASGAAIAVAATCAVPTGAQAPDARPPCNLTLVAMDDTIDSAKAKSGDVFTFRLVDPTKAPDGTPLPSGTLGYGIVANAAHADKGGRGGYLALEARFFALPDGRHVPAIIDRANDEASAAVGASGNAPGVLGLLPIVGYAVGGYDSLHHGRDATIPKGTRIRVYVGDAAAMGTCRPLAAGQSPAPATPTPAPTPVPTATPVAAPPPVAVPSPSPSPRP